MLKTLKRESSARTKSIGKTTVPFSSFCILSESSHVWLKCLSRFTSNNIMPSSKGNKKSEKSNKKANLPKEELAFLIENTKYSKQEIK